MSSTGQSGQAKSCGFISGAGLIHLRQGGLTVGDQMLAAEKAGAWSEAVALYEQALSHEAQQAYSRLATSNVATAVAALSQGARAVGAAALHVPGQTSVNGPSEGLSPHQLGHLRCLLQMGHLQTVLRQVDGLMARSGPGVSNRSTPDVVAGVVCPATTSLCQLAAVGVAASWRLGAWGLLQVRMRKCRRYYMEVCMCWGCGVRANPECCLS